MGARFPHFRLFVETLGVRVTVCLNANGSKRMETNDKPRASESIEVAARESLNDFTGKTSRFALILVGILVSFGVISIALNHFNRQDLISDLTKDSVALLVVCVIAVHLLFLSRQLPITRATRLCLYLFLASGVLHLVLGITDEVRGLDDVPILGNDSRLNKPIRDALRATAVCRFNGTNWLVTKSFPWLSAMEFGLLTSEHPRLE